MNSIGCFFLPMNLSYEIHCINKARHLTSICVWGKQSPSSVTLQHVVLTALVYITSRYEGHVVGRLFKHRAKLISNSHTDVGSLRLTSMPTCGFYKTYVTCTKLPCTRKSLIVLELYHLYLLGFLWLVGCLSTRQNWFLTHTLMWAHSGWPQCQLVVFTKRMFVHKTSMY